MLPSLAEGITGWRTLEDYGSTQIIFLSESLVGINSARISYAPPEEVPVGLGESGETRRVMLDVNPLHAERLDQTVRMLAKHREKFG